ncbi:hypothetical protein BH11VER1_BH11VER1_29880 [soil metagenome]
MQSQPTDDLSEETTESSVASVRRKVKKRKLAITTNPNTIYLVGAILMAILIFLELVLLVSSLIK